MPRICVEMLPWLSQEVVPGHIGRLRLDIEVQGGRVQDLLEALAVMYPNFAGKVYDPERRNTTDLVEIAINDRMLSYSGTLDAAIADGDKVMFIPSYGGG
jgi:molybdopterin converting factor small subunit